MAKKERSEETIVVDSTFKLEYLFKYKYNALVASADRKTRVVIDSQQQNGFPLSIQINGASDDVKQATDTVRDIVNGVKTSRFVISVGKGVRDVSFAEKAVDVRTPCTVEVEHISTVDPSPDLIPVVLKCQAQAVNTTTVTTLLAELQHQQADVIVNTAHRNLTMGVGGISAALLQVCGAGVQEELRLEYPQGVEYGEVAETGPGELTTCKAIYHGALPFMKGLTAVSLDTCYIYILVYSVTQKVCSEQLNNTATLHARLRASHSERFEVMFRVGKTLVKVINADTDSACHSSSPVLILWTEEEIQDPSLNKSVKCVCANQSDNEQFHSVVANLAKSQAVLDSRSITSRTLLHCYCVGDKDNDITTAIQHGLEQAHKHCSPTVSIPIPSEGRLSERPMDTCEAVLKAVKKCSSRVSAIAVVIPDEKVFVPFVSKATNLYKLLEAADLDTTTLVENTWFDSFADWSKFKSFEALKKGDYCVVTVTSDSEETNKRVAMKVQDRIENHTSTSVC